MKLYINNIVIVKIVSNQQQFHNGNKEIFFIAIESYSNRIVQKPHTWLPGLKDSLIASCKSKLGALGMHATFKQKKILAEACILSRVTYAIQVWGVAIKPTELSRVQSLQHLVGCWVGSQVSNFWPWESILYLKLDGYQYTN